MEQQNRATSLNSDNNDENLITALLRTQAIKSSSTVIPSPSEEETAAAASPQTVVGFVLLNPNSQPPPKDAAAIQQIAGRRWPNKNVAVADYVMPTSQEAIIAENLSTTMDYGVDGQHLLDNLALSSQNAAVQLHSAAAAVGTEQNNAVVRRGNTSRHGTKAKRPGNIHHHRHRGRFANDPSLALAKQQQQQQRRQQRHHHEQQQQQQVIQQQQNFIQLAGISARELGHPADDVVRCFCGDSSEDGLMVQCEQCQAWQHSHCLGYSEHNVPSSYICIFCEHLPHTMYSVRYSARDHATCTQQLVNVDSALYALPRHVQYDKTAEPPPLPPHFSGGSSSSLLPLMSLPSTTTGLSAAVQQHSQKCATFQNSIVMPSQLQEHQQQQSMSNSSSTSPPSIVGWELQQQNAAVIHHPVSVTTTRSTSNSRETVTTTTTSTAGASCGLDTVDGLNKFRLEIQAFMKEISVMVNQYKQRFAEINLHAFDPSKLKFLPSPPPTVQSHSQPSSAQTTASSNTRKRKVEEDHASLASMENGESTNCMQKLKLLKPNGLILPAATTTTILDQYHNNSSRAEVIKKTVKRMRRDLDALGVETTTSSHSINNQNSHGSNSASSYRLRQYAEKLLLTATNQPQLCNGNNNNYITAASSTSESSSSGSISSSNSAELNAERLKLLSALREVNEDAQASELSKCLTAINKLSAFARHVQQRTRQMQEQFYGRNEQYLTAHQQPMNNSKNSVAGVGSHMHGAVNRLRNLQGACKTLSQHFAHNSSLSYVASSANTNNSDAVPTKSSSSAATAAAAMQQQQQNHVRQSSSVQPISSAAAPAAAVHAAVTKLPKVAPRIVVATSHSALLPSSNVVSVLSLPDLRAALPNNASNNNSFIKRSAEAAALNNSNGHVTTKRRRRRKSGGLSNDAAHNNSNSKLAAASGSDNIFAQTLLSSFSPDDVGVTGGENNEDADDISATSVAAQRYRAMRSWYRHRKAELFFNTRLPRTLSNSNSGAGVGGANASTGGGGGGFARNGT